MRRLGYFDIWLVAMSNVRGTALLNRGAGAVGLAVIEALLVGSACAVTAPVVGITFRGTFTATALGVASIFSNRTVRSFLLLTVDLSPCRTTFDGPRPPRNKADLLEVVDPKDPA